jgi:hypothetical protein
MKYQKVQGRGGALWSRMANSGPCGAFSLLSTGLKL